MRWRSLKEPHADRLSALRQRAPHEILGVSSSASEAEIKAAYRRQARAYHPDFVHPFMRSHSEEMMKLLNRAYRAMMSRHGQ